MRAKHCGDLHMSGLVTAKDFGDVRPEQFGTGEQCIFVLT